METLRRVHQPEGMDLIHQLTPISAFTNNERVCFFFGVYHHNY